MRGGCAARCHPCSSGCRGARSHAVPTTSSTFTRSALDTNWRANDTKRPAAVGLRLLRPAHKAAPLPDTQSKPAFSVLLQTLSENPHSHWIETPHSTLTTPRSKHPPKLEGERKKRQSRPDLIMFMGFRRDSREAYHERTNL